MHSELMNNSLFLRYYNAWREDPSSIVFAPVADYFLMYGRVEDAITVCKEGLKHNPDSVSGRMLMAKACLVRGDLKEADKELKHVLELVPTHSRAQELRTEIDLALRGEIGPAAIMAKPVEEPESEPPSSAIEEAPIETKEIEPEPEEELAVEKKDEWDRALMSAEPAAWQTVTMAKIYAAQGHDDKARSIYQAILSNDPANEAARDGLHDLGGGR
jgi:tetratricopeptide (TPR) repeat protein